VNAPRLLDSTKIGGAASSDKGAAIPASSRGIHILMDGKHDGSTTLTTPVELSTVVPAVEGEA